MSIFGFRDTFGDCDASSVVLVRKCRVASKSQEYFGGSILLFFWQQRDFSDSFL